MQQSLTKGLGEGALMAALTAIFALAGIYIPIINLITILIVAVPITLVIVRNDFRIGFISSLVAGFLVAMLAGPIMAVTFYIQFMSMALAYGYLFKKKTKAGKIIIAGTAVSVISTLLLLMISFAIINTDFETQKDFMLQTVDETMIMYEKYGLLDQITEQGISKEEFKKAMVDSVNLFITVLPAILILASIFSSVINFIVTRSILRRFGHEVDKLPPFSQWRLPWYAVWGVIFGWGSYLIGDYFGISAGIMIGKNILIAYSFVLFVLGLSVISFFWKKIKVNFIGRLIFLFLLIFLARSIILLAIAIGLFDLVLDYRKRIKINKAEK
ncbi:Uncharacterized conserved protein YybS, DUF2232 family [Desulfonispora thiosulfatigenes DSM 11270]|uniref:Uncharacterized conserved protein YybS, DUF2232 family n=1 Tax=Desulfonispora thiosulfatigenes DSM 11270 TaxID=656914 RepID=A0A1W1V330_DESTI|nr:YybS family protein [Desulfonispora thiosulfatigenes]SMB87708.1 Uncharacterized conserved protein YybS, DUF2232 family [Desulfonispora thiosulfatigenes DSM 11270]